MRLSCIICTLILIALGICGGVWAFTGFDALLFLCLKSVTAKRAVLAVGAVAALFEGYALCVFKPFKGLK